MKLEERANAALIEARELSKQLEVSIARGRVLLAACRQSDLEMEKAMYGEGARLAQARRVTEPWVS
jgi:hypothetical protein